MLRSLLLSAVLLVQSVAHAQLQCGFHAPATPVQPRPLDHSVRGGGGPFLIPTVVQVHYGGGLMPLTPEQVVRLLDDCNEQLRAQNADLADVVPAFADLVGDAGMELRLATRDAEGQCMSGIRYHLFDPATEQAEPYQNSIDTRRYLNIHIGPWGISFATYPTVVTAPYDPSDCIMLGGGYTGMASTLVHEVGHMFALTHTFGNTNNTGTCNDDGIADTPITAGSPLNCILDRSECTPGVIENVQNHMDYSDCRIMFTQGQVDRMQAVLADPTLVRYGLVQPANLLSTGVEQQQPTCGFSVGLHSRATVSCTGTTVLFHAIAEGQLPDSVRWTFTGASNSTSTSQNATAFYPTAGTYPVQLTAYHNGSAQSVSSTVTVDVPTPYANTLEMVAELPYTNGFDAGTDAQHMTVEQTTDGGWLPFTSAGYASSSSLYVPPGNVTVADTSDLHIGNFDLRDLVLPTVRFRVASTLTPLTGWSQLQLRFRDLCSNIFVGELWADRGLNEFATDQGTNFVPSSDGQWQTYSVSFPEWNLASGAEFTIRLIRPAQPAIFTAEAVYIDDVYVGELPVNTGVEEDTRSAPLLLHPNPASDVVQCVAAAGSGLQLVDLQGRVVRQWTSTGGIQRLAIHDLPRGLHVLRSSDGTAARVVLQ
ncbi:MAG: M43 family zinc metalloprotease [Flavobacteriales bacterium]|nr:M43 family zinc metalloprotease [Flavobacteriales bacterium]